MNKKGYGPWPNESQRYTAGCDPAHEIKWYQKILKFFGLYKETIYIIRKNDDGSYEYLK